jgi:oxygen-independent coproporphyrinogen-3 oxidase
MPNASETSFAAPVEADRQVFSPEEIFAAGTRNHHISNTAYPIAHSQTFKPYRLERALHRETVERAFADTPDICLYSHIPFCETRCFFCEYTVVGKSELERTRDYMTALNRETEMYAELLGPRTLHGWDIGGGTPSFPPAEFIAEHIGVVKQNFAVSPRFRDQH